ncbi:putative phage late gene regulator [Escherichia coli]|nr:putative phage late gene regulator [Escherichia coli]
MEGADGNVFCVTQDLSERAGSKTRSGGKVAATTTRSRIILHHAGAWTCRTLPEMHGTVTGFKSEIDNQDWIIAKAEHTIDNSGFTTQLELEAKSRNG